MQKNILVINEQVLTGTVNGITQSIINITEICQHPCIKIHKELKLSILGDRGVRTIKCRKTPLIGFVQPKLIEHSHI